MCFIMTGKYDQWSLWQLNLRIPPKPSNNCYKTRPPFAVPMILNQPCIYFVLNSSPGIKHGRFGVSHWIERLDLMWKKIFIGLIQLWCAVKIYWKTIWLQIFWFNLMSEKRYNQSTFFNKLCGNHITIFWKC